MEELQQIAELLRNAAYSDDRLGNDKMPKIDWSIRVTIPRTDRGNLYFSCGIWNNKGPSEPKFASMSFVYEVNIGMKDLQKWNEHGSIYFPPGKFTLERLKTEILMLFSIEKLYEPKETKQ